MSELFESKVFSLRVVSVACVRLLVIILSATILASCKSELYSNLSEQQVNEMIMVLEAEGIEADRSKNDEDNFSLEIKRADFARSISILSSRGLPGKSYQSLGEVFKSDKIVSTPFEERARFMYALSQELSQSITKINGIVSARVHIIIPEAQPFSEVKSDARASIFIYHAPDVDITKNVPVIKNLITRSVDGLVYENVTVALFATQATEFSSQASNLRANNTDSSGLQNYSQVITFLLIGGAVFLFLSWAVNKVSRQIPKPVLLEKHKIRRKQT